MGGRSKAPVSIDIDAKLTQLDSRLQKVQSLYDQHFAGVLKREPSKEHQDFRASLSSVTPADLKTTAAKFRFQSLQSRHLQLSTLWSKILKQMEEGTYKRDLFLLEKKHAHEKVAPTPPTHAEMPAAPKAKKHLELLYEKMSKMISKEQKLPEKQAFIASIDKQISALKQKNPDKKIELKIHKNEAGKLEVKIKVAKESGK
jgi:hypothetical protein